MSKSFLFLSLLVLPMWMQGQQVNSELKEARIFVWGAEIHRSADVSVSPGNNELIFTGLPPDIDPNSIQIKAEGAITILSVGHRHNFLESAQSSQQVKSLSDSLEYLKNEIESLQALLRVYEEEESMLLANKSIGGSDTGVNVAELKTMADFFRSRLREIKNLQLDTKQEITMLKERQSRIQNQLGRINREKKPVSEIVVNAAASSGTRVQFDISYITHQARWQALYDIRAVDTAEPVELLMKASIEQSTGEDWNNIQLTLSTGTPLDNRVVPTLNTWFLRYIEPVAQKPLVIRGMATRQAQAPEMAMDDDIVLDEMVMAGSAAEYTEVSQTNTTREYRIGAPVSVVSGGDEKIIEVRQHELPASFTWYAIPRVDNDAYLIARVSEWEEYIVLPGEAGVFFENAFVGKTMLDPMQAGDTLEISMGIDRGLSLERVRMIEQSRKSIFGRYITETVGWEIKVKNNKNRQVDLEIKDQIPVSTQDNMLIYLDEKSGADHNESTGILTWRLQMDAGESLSRTFRYSVKYPQDKKVRLE